MKRYKVRMLQSLAGLSDVLLPQDEIELDEETAKRWEELQYSEIIEEIEEEKTPKKKRGEK